jgi:hypothetical protein
LRYENAASLLPRRYIAHVLAAEPGDLLAPKTAGAQALRVLLHIGAGERLIDYPDVSKVLDCGDAQITFETHDGLIVTHRGAFTLIQQRSSFDAHQSRGVRFYDAK